MNIPAFTLYGLIGCPHCGEAETFLKTRNIPFSVVVANEDPIANAGVTQIVGEGVYPALVYKVTKEVLRGFVREDYERVISHFGSILSASSPNVFSNGQQPIPQVTSESQAPPVH